MVKERARMEIMSPVIVQKHDSSAVRRILVRPIIQRFAEFRCGFRKEYHYLSGEQSRFELSDSWKPSPTICTPALTPRST